VKFPFKSDEFLLMKSKAFLLVFLFGTICVGQSVLTTPNVGSQSAPANSPAPAASNAQAPLQGPAQVGGNPTSGAMAPETPAAPPPEERPQASNPNTVVGPLTAKSDFEQFAEDATGLTLPVYGRQLFNGVPTTFAPVENVPVPADYVLGPGDQLLIRAWGKIDLDYRVTVDRNGQINLPKVGTLTVAGLRYAQVEGYLRSAIGALFTGFELNVTLGQLRSIQIFVLGEGRQPGVYTISSLSTLVDALFASGGPSATGTMRHIQLRRGNRVLTEFDIYDLVQRGDKSHDVQLLPGDVIYIPPIGAQVAISGNVNEPGIYELKGETTIASALQGAGGLTNIAGVGRAVLERIENHSNRRVEEFALDASSLQRPLKDGDLLRIFPLSPKFENAVTLRGNVAAPGRYVWKEGMRISDLIPSRESLITSGYWNRQNHVSLGSGGITANNAEIDWDHAVIERLDEHDLSTRLIPFHLGNAIDNPASIDNQLLRAGDIVTIFSRADIALPMEQHATFVSVSGEVNAPGLYRVNPGDTLRGVVQEAGGLTQHSYLYASVFTRVSTRVAQEAQLRQAADQMQKELIAKYANATTQAGQTGADQQAQLVLQQATLAKLTSIAPTGRVVLNMNPNAATIEDIPVFPLEDGDAFYISPRLGTVQVVGAVYNANAFRYEPGKRLIAYLNDAGGATREADQKRIYVIRADGTVVSRQSRNSHSHGSYDNLKLLPGDAVVVPEKIRVSSPMNNFLEASQLASQTALTAAALSIIK
jgi:protein involved in polysaccharide export with SLBB domain